MKVPVAPVPCLVPPFHTQAECGGDEACLLTEFALTLQAEQTVRDALAGCRAVKLEGGAQ